MEERFNSLRILKNFFNSWSHIEKQERFDSLSQTERLQLFESHWEEVYKKRLNSMSPFSRVLFSFFFWHTVQFFESYFLIKWFNSLRQMKEKGFNSLRHIQRNGFNSLRRIERKRFNSLRRMQKKKFNSLSHAKAVNMKERFTSLRHIGKQERFNSLRRKKFNPLSHRKISSLWNIRKNIWVIFFKKKPVIFENLVHFLESYLKKFNSESHKKGQFCESYQRKKSSILWVTLQKKFNSLGHI